MRSLKPLASFVWFCLNHRYLRFWQAMWIWAGAGIIIAPIKVDVVTLLKKNPELRDPFYWEDGKCPLKF